MQRMKIRLVDSLFYMALFLWIINFMFVNLSAFNVPKILVYFLQISIIILLGLKYLFQNKYTIKKLFFSVMLIVASFAVYITGGYKDLVLNILLIVSADGIDFRKIVKVIFKETLACFILLIVFNRMGFLPDYTYSHEGMIAHSFGLKYYGHIGYILMMAIMSYCFLKKKPCSWIELLALFTINFLTYSIHTTRLSTGLVYVFLICYALIYKLQWIKLKKRIWLWIASLLPITLFAVSMVLVVAAARGINFSNFYNGGLGVRLLYSVIGFQKYGLHLLGTPIQTAGGYALTYGGSKQEAFFIDIGYVYILISYGILFTIVLLLLYTLLYRYLYKQKMTLCYLWLGVMLMGSLINDFLISPIYNPLIFLMPQAISGVIRSYLSFSENVKNTGSLNFSRDNG